MKIAKIISGFILIALGVVVFACSVWQLFSTHYWGWIWLALIGLVIALPGFEVVSGGSLKEALKDIFSSLMWWS